VSLAEAEAQQALLAWGVPRLRDLPWRHTRDPWGVLVSEVMLQQTQALRVVPRWRSFLARFPTPVACAAAALGDVLREWQGLGYPRRAANLHGSAGAMVERFGGRVPATLADLMALPGIGPYTARAVLAFAFEENAAVVDTNVARVLARSEGARLTPKAAQAAADAALPAGEAWAWNQSMIDLGASTCRPETPRCDACPVERWCAWTAAARPEPDPAVGSAHVSRAQAPYDGSDRQARGRLLARLASGSLAEVEAGEAIGLGHDGPRAAAVVTSLVADGLVVRQADGSLALPS
jgi:A/G-specific adenine glycosylase